MADDQCNSGLVHQVFMGYDGHGSQGMCALASSFHDLTLHKQWEQDLIHHVRLHPFGQVDPPPYAFTYITFGNSRAAILRRVQEGDSLGRNNGHALVGPAAFLGPLALRLTHTLRWAARPEEMGQDPYPVEQLREMAPSSCGDVLLDDGGDSDLCKDSACRILSRVLANPGLNVSSIGLDHNLVIPTLELFEAVLRPLFAVEPLIRSWSFSTYEDRDADPGGSFRLPELIFLPVLPSHAGETYHDRIFLDESVHVDDLYHQLAERLVRNYLKLGPEEYFSAIEHELSSKETIASRIRYLLGGRAHGSSLRHRIPEASDQLIKEPRQSGVRDEPTGWSPATEGYAFTANLRGTPSPSSVPNPPRISNRPMSESVRPGTKPIGRKPQAWLSDHELVRQLANAVTRPEANEIISILCTRVGPAPDKHRWKLISSPDVLNSLAVIFWPWELNVAYRGLLEFAFGVDAKALQRQEYLNWFKGYIRRPKANYFFDHAVFSLVEGSPVAAQYHDLLRRRWEKVPSIPLMERHDTDLPYIRHRSGNLLELSRNRQLITVLSLAILMMGIITASIVYT